MLGSGKNSILPVSDPPSDQERERLIGADDDEKFFRGSAMTRRGAYAAISYMACAVLLVMFNKAALSSYKFPSANVITLFQIICSCGFLYTLRRWNMISFTVGESSIIYDDNATTLVPLKTLKKTLPLAGAYLMYMLASMESVRGVNVPMYTTLRRTTVVFTMVMEYILAGQRYTSPIVRSVGVIVLGAFVAGSRDFSFDAYGYGVVFLSNITTAVYLATIARIGKSSGLNSFGLMWCNGFICGPVLLFLTFIRGDLKTTIDFPYLLSPGFMVHSLPMLLFSANACTLNSSQWYLLKEKNKELFVSSILHLPYGFPAFHRFSRLQLLEYNMLFLLAVLKYNFQVTPVVLIEIHRCFLFSPSLWQAVLLCSCILAFFLNYSIFLNTTLNSALTQTICGNLKDFFTIGLGWMLFGGLRFDILNVIGQFLGFLGSGLYAYYKLIGK